MKCEPAKQVPFTLATVTWFILSAGQRKSRLPQWTTMSEIPFTVRAPLSRPIERIPLHTADLRAEALDMLRVPETLTEQSMSAEIVQIRDYKAKRDAETRPVFVLGRAIREENREKAPYNGAGIDGMGLEKSE
jgi:hypothetical protein